MSDREDFEYEVCLSFAGEQRDYVEQVAKELQSRGIRVFFDDNEKISLWGKDLYSHLKEVYQRKCQYCILFASKEYADKVWTNHERESAQARAINEKEEYILPARFDDTPIPGLKDTVHYIDLKDISPLELAELAFKKIGNPLRKEYMPPVLDVLFDYLDVDEDDYNAQEYISLTAWSFLQSLKRMSSDERDAVLSLITFGCPAELPQNIHINVDFLRRITGESVARLKTLLGGIGSLGFECFIRESTDEEESINGIILDGRYMFEFNWVNRLISDRIANDPRYKPLFIVCNMVMLATAGLCEEHGAEALSRLDFSQLSKATILEDSHGG